MTNKCELDKVPMESREGGERKKKKKKKRKDKEMAHTGMLKQ
jgi:hypothetical protein